MAPPRVVDPTKFLLLGAVTDWWRIFRRLGKAASPDELARLRGLAATRLVQLRWVTDPALGYPTEPFIVWRRPSKRAEAEKPVAWTQIDFLGQSVVVFDRPRVFVRATLQGPGGAVMAFSGIPHFSAMLPPRTVPAGTSVVGFSAPAVQSLLLPAGTVLQNLTGLDGVSAVDLDWERVEFVGLPVDATFQGVQNLDAPQGLVSTLGDPRTAALDRFRRGAPFYGWENQLSPGVAAPVWELAEPKAMLQVIEESVLPPLLQMVTTLSAEQHASYEITRNLSAAGGGQPAVATISPLRTLVFGAATDPLVSLVTGFGTAFEDEPGDDQASGNGASRWDYMVTAHYENGTDNQPGPIEYAAMVFAPGLVGQPPTPAGLAATSDGLRSPAVTDADWISVTRINWDRIADTLPFRVGSYALARAQVAPAGGVAAVMDPRPYDTALQPISSSTSPEQEASGRLAALDDRYQVASAPNPNAVTYAVAHQDLFGTWSSWGTTPFAIGEPSPGRAALISARLDVTPAGGICPADLTIEFSWNWSTRSPRRIQLVGRLYPQSALGEPPADLSLPAGFPASLTGGAGVPLTVEFGGDGLGNVTGLTAGLTATLAYVSLDGKTLEPAPVTPAAPRRYRLRISGFALDFAVGGRLGLALWARGTEARSPQRVGPWTAQPLIASAADPRPPVLSVEHEDVLMASVGDAAGEHHARLEWPAASGSVSYFVYTCTEVKLRADRGMTDPPLRLTLSQRLAELRAAFAANPDRRSFTRVNATPVAGTSMTVTLPRGTKEIHLYIVLGLSAGQVESAWPTTADPLLRKRPIAYAAPQIVVPAPPTIEVTRVLDAGFVPARYAASVRIREVAGAPVSRVDLHRVRVPEAAASLDAMGPPLARITGSTPQYTVTPTVSTEVGGSQPLGTITGVDPVPGSWSPVYYRAVAWSADDPQRGLYGGRSGPSTIRQVVVPPAEDPDLDPLAWAAPTPGSPDIQVDTGTAVPVATTVLGPHRIQAEVLAEHANGKSEIIYRYPAPAGPPDADRLDLAPGTPPGPGTSGLWLDASTPSGTPVHLLIRRTDYADVLRVRIRVSDPLGRMTERLLEVPAGNPVVPPDILNPQLTQIAGRGTVLTFDTTVPDEIPGVGDYTLRVLYRVPVAPPHPLPVEQLTAGGRIADIPGVAPGENVFDDPAAIPLRQLPRPPGLRTIGMVLRRTGSVRVDLFAPDGTSVTLSRKVT
jgi:hypothetical protein